MQKENLKVLHWSQLYPPSKGGIELVAWELVEGLRKKKIHTDVLCCSANHDSVEPLDHVFRCKTTFFWARVYFSIECIYKWLKIRNQYNIIHVHCPHPFANLLLFLIPTKAHLIVHWHSDIVRPKLLKKFYLPLQRWLLRRADAVIATSPNYASSSTDLLPIKNKVTIIPIGINPERLLVNSTKLREIKNKFSDKIIVFALGRHVYYKGFEYLIKAFKTLPANFILLLGGEGPEQQKLRQIAHDAGVKNKVVFLGKIAEENLGSYFQCCDIFCLPSIERSEAFGVVQLEAMSKGKPVVSTKIPGSGVSWVNQNGVSGIVIPPKDEKELAKALAGIGSGHTCLGNIANYVENNFNLKSMINEVIKLYNKIN
ncbi:glycosyltransferase [Halodesulfovibrio aestuarii]|uniref:glycosyltransferase n=1 Tax=Halodesulfovibrio aestuarii TaxID=126333 RepID=UPI003D330759